MSDFYSLQKLNPVYYGKPYLYYIAQVVARSLKHAILALYAV